ncbi:MAG: Stf0 family sulfotransferase, partial [Xenococcus sp. (in: cyanobacteria)]
IEALRNFIASKSESHFDYEYDYLSWAETHKDLTIIKQQKYLDYQAIIIVSMKNESFIYETINNYALEQNININILRLFSDIFINIMSHQELLQYCDYELQTPEMAYAIVTTPRSGSTFICSLLQSTKIAGYPAEYFREPSLTLVKECHFDYVRYLRILMHNRITKNRVFGTKIMARFLRDFEKTEFDFQGFIKNYISKIIYLNRIDKVAQAVSLLIAQKTNSWHINKDKKQEDYHKFLNSIEINDADLVAIDKTVTNLVEANKYLKYLFEKYDINTLKLDYEKFEVEPEAYVAKILDFLNISDENNIEVKSSFKKISSSLSQQTIMRYEQKYVKKLGAQHIKILNQLVNIYENAEKSEQTAFYYQRITQLQPDNASVYYKLAKLEEIQGNTEKAIQTYQKSLALKFLHPAKVYIRLGDIFSQDGNIEKAISAYEKALELDSDSISALNGLGEIYENRKEITQASSYYQRIVKLLPNDNSAYLKLASLLFRQDNFKRAIENYNKALEIKTDQPAWVYIGLGDALNRNNQLDEASAAFQKAIEIDPNNGIAYAKLANALANKGNDFEAVDIYQKAFSLQSKQPFWSYISFAKALYKNNQIDQTISICQQALDIQPNNVTINLLLAESQEAKGDMEAAIGSYQKLIKLDPQPKFEVYRRLGNLQVEKGNYQLAIDSYVKCLKVNHNGFGNYAHLDEALYNLYGDGQSTLFQNISKLFNPIDYKEIGVVQGLQSYLKLGFLGKKGATIDPLSYYFINHNLRIVYCSIPKNACTLFKNLIVDNSDNKEEYELSQQNVHQFLANRRGNIFPLLSCLESPDYFKFVILRNPFARLASAYLDKFAKHPFPESFARDVIREVQQFLGLEINIEKSITFSQFIEYLARTKDRNLNDHWRPQNTFIGSVKFDLVGQFENLDYVIDFLQRKYKINIKKKVSSHITNYKDFSSDLQFHQMYPNKLRNLDGMPKAWQLYTPELEAIVRKRYAQDIEIYKQYFQVSLDDLQTCLQKL